MKETKKHNTEREKEYQWSDVEEIVWGSIDDDDYVHATQEDIIRIIRRIMR